MDLPEPPFPSLADALWLGLYPALYVSLMLFVRARVPRFHRSLWLDGLVGGLAVASVAAAEVFKPVLESTGGGAAAVATNLAYPRAEMLLLAFVGGRHGAHRVAAGVRAQPHGAGLLVLALSDSIFLYEAATGSYREGGLLDAGYVVGLLLVALAAYQPERTPQPVVLGGYRVLVAPTAFTLVALGVLGWAQIDSRGPLASVLALATLLAAMVRAALTFRENVRLADSRRQATRVVDALESILGAAGEGIGALDCQGRITYANPAAAQLAGRPVEQLLGREFHTLLGRVDGPLRAAPVMGSDPPHEAESVLRRADGSEVPVEYVRTSAGEGGVARTSWSCATSASDAPSTS